MEWIAIPLGALTVLATLAGGLLALRLSHSLSVALALSGGVVVAVAIFELLPEAMENLDDPRAVGGLLGAGFLVFFLAERVLVLHHRDDPDQARAHSRVGILGALGLSAHSFVDGLGIGLAFGVDEATGFLVFIAVITHDFADGLNLVNFVLSQSADRRQARRWLAIDAIAPLLGATLGTLLSVSAATLGGLLAVYAGFFIYMGATDLLPEAHEHAAWNRVALTLAGFGVIFLVSVLAAH